MRDLNRTTWLARMMSCPNSATNAYMMLSYQYYICDRSIVHDTDYDDICKYLLKHYDKITHEHKKFFTEEDLESGTGFQISQNDYPLIVVGASDIMLRTFGEI